MSDPVALVALAMILPALVVLGVLAALGTLVVALSRVAETG